MKKNKTALAIAMLLTLTMTIAIFSLPAAYAQTNLIEKKTYAYIGATPNPVGVGQETLIHLGITDELQNVAHFWTGLTVTVTKPDGTTETLGPFNTDSTGGTGTVYIPSTVGTYYFQTHFPAQRYNWTSYGGASVWYKASDSEKLAVNVTQEQNQIWPGIPLPTDYWTRPIDSQLREWSAIAGNWIDDPSNLIAPYNDGPETAHILWSDILDTGGIAGGEVGDHSYEDGDAYEGFFADSVIIGGVLYYNRFNANGGTRVEQEVVAMDLHTGEQLWVRNWNNTRLTTGQVFYWDSYNYHGVFSYLWSVSGSTWNAYDPLNGRWMYRMEGVPGGSNVYGPKGEIYRYTADLARGWMTLWNSSRVVSTSGSWIRNSLGTTYNVSQNGYQTRPRNAGYEWNKTIPVGLPGAINAYFFEDLILGSDLVSRTAENLISGRINKPIPLWAISTKPGQEGMLLFNTTWTPPNDDLFISFGAVSQEDRVFTLWSKETRQHWGFSLDTGKQLWGPTEPQFYLDIFGQRRFIAYGKLFAQGMSGILNCYDVKTGKLLWTYSYKDPLNEVLWANDWSIRPVFFTDGKIYMGQSEHSPVDPKPRGGPFVCVDVETGKEVWSIDGAFRQNDWGGRAIIGDSIIATYNSYDQRIYAISKGPSATTVSAPDVGVTLGSTVLIKGMVTDVSPGTKEYAMTARFPNGVPAVSDASMSGWMKYVYMQFPKPKDTVGVEVTLNVIDSNGNFREIGKATSDSEGFYSLMWTPDIEGKYTVIASFAGSAGYWPSIGETALAVTEALPPPEQIAPLPSNTDTYVMYSAVGIIVAIAAVGALLALLVRKRP